MKYNEPVGNASYSCQKFLHGYTPQNCLQLENVGGKAVKGT